MTGPALFERAKPGGRIVVAKVAEYNGSRFLDIREWVAGEGEPTATRKGVTIPLEAMRPLGEALIAGAGGMPPGGALPAA
ncbi:transcriptional coactivator p15/PC4 family protein [Sphingomonas oligophenolica]|nr:transcriptional coactivator p15/PC4 family protein [Sphingomonas oligophenolica]